LTPARATDEFACLRAARPRAVVSRCIDEHLGRHRRQRQLQVDAIEQWPRDARAITPHLLLVAATGRLDLASPPAGTGIHRRD
jgi:hypothetical protein